MNENQLKAILGVTLGTIIWITTGGCLGVDSSTGLTCSELKENPGQDIYFIVDSSDFNDAIWESAQQNLETVRWNVAHDKFVVKYNAKDVPRGETGLTKALNNPMTNSEILPIVNGVGWVDENVISVKDTDTIFVDDRIE